MHTNDIFHTFKLSIDKIYEKDANRMQTAKNQNQKVKF